MRRTIDSRKMDTKQLSQKVKGRLSNLELLRIISIFLIILHHYTVHSGFNFSSDVTVNKVIVQLLSMGGKLGVNCFVLISGYFLCTSTKSRWRSVVLFIVKLTVISVSIYLIFVGLGKIEFELEEFKRRALPLLNNYWWFANTFFVLMLLSPMINRILNRITKKEHFSAIVLFTVLWCYIPTATLAYMESNNLIWFIYLYVVAAYIRKYPSVLTESKKMLLTALTVSLLAMIGSILLLDHFGQKIPIYAEQAMHFVDMQGVLSMVFCISIFCLFKNFKPFVNRGINLIAGSIFSVYLIHDHGYIRPIVWQKILRGGEYQESGMLLLHALVSVLAVFAVCTVVGVILTFVVDKPVMYLLRRYGDGMERAALRVKNGIKKAVRNIYDGAKPN